MPFPIELKYILETEKEMEYQFPEIFKQKMQKENGGEFFTEDDDWFLFPFLDSSNYKRISRTCNHIALETKKAKEWKGFPHNAVAIGTNQSGDFLILKEKEPKILGEEIYVWYHEGEIVEVAKNINDYDEPDEVWDNE